MRTTVTEDGLICLEEVYNPVVFHTIGEEILYVCMRNSGYFLTYEGKPYWMQGGEVLGHTKNNVLDLLFAP